MKRRTLLATAGGATLFGTAGCYGIASLISRSDSGDQQQEENNSSENATGRVQTNKHNTTGNDTNETTTDEERNESAESSEENAEGNASDEGSNRPSDPVDTITVTDHGLDVSESSEKDVDREIHCYGTFEAGEHALRDVRIDAVALAENGDRLDHGWVPFAKVGAGESYDVDIPFYVNPDEIAEYLIGATEATYVE